MKMTPDVAYPRQHVPYVDAKDSQQERPMTETPIEPLPAGIRSRFVDNINGLRMHVLEAGFDGKNRPCLLLLHGFPELAYSWRKVMLPLAAAGYHVVAPDQRGYGRTTGWDADYDGDLGSFRLLNLGRDTSGAGFGARIPLRGGRHRPRLRVAGCRILCAGTAGCV